MSRSAEQLLETFLTPAAAVPVTFYKAYVAQRLAGPEYSIDDCQTLCVHFRCAVGELSEKVTQRKLGKG